VPYASPIPFCNITTDITGFDRTIHETNTWLRDISEILGDPRPNIAYHALRGTLFALRDRLPPVEVFDLSAQLPVLIRGLGEAFSKGIRSTPGALFQ